MRSNSPRLCVKHLKMVSSTTRPSRPLIFPSRLMESSKRLPKNIKAKVIYIGLNTLLITLQEELVFANYGSYEDFEYLEGKLNISVKGRLLLVRYGKFFRGDKVQNAQRFGAAGMILYSDPADYSTSETDSYPSSWWLPGEGVQRGTINWRDGDPSTPMYPALDGAFRIAEENWKDLPKIPVHPVGFNDALKIIVQMAGPKVPSNWRGGLNATYRLGPQLRTPGWYRSDFFFNSASSILGTFPA